MFLMSTGMGQQQRGRGTKVRCECGAELHELKPGEQLAHRSTGDPTKFTCRGCGRVTEISVQLSQVPR